MKTIVKYFCGGLLLVSSGLLTVSCDDFLDREPLTSVTPESYFVSAEQLGAYVLNYYPGYFSTYGGRSHGLAQNDNNTDNYLVGDGDLGLFACRKLVGSGQAFSFFSNVRVWNWMLEQVLPKEKNGTIAGDVHDIRHYIGEAYFFRAMTYFNALVSFGDIPIVTEVLPDDQEILAQHSVRQPRNEVARFILKDLDEAISRLHDKGFKNNLRVNKQVALLIKSRVALFEATFEKYHRGSGRIPGDETWPGAKFNPDKSFDIDGEIVFFLDEAMNAAKQVADGVRLTPNSHQINPELGQIKDWNPYFEMFALEDMSKVDEILLWKQYSFEEGILHDVPYTILRSGQQQGYCRSLINSFLMKDGLPYYASSNYLGDESIDNVKSNRDERLQLFVCGESDVIRSDNKDPLVIEKGDVVRKDSAVLVSKVVADRDFTGYRTRKYFNYDYEQYYTNNHAGKTGCFVYRGTEALLNYIEACYERNNTLDQTAKNYWKALRDRAGVSSDLEGTDAATNLDKEFNMVGNTIYGDLAVYSGDKKVSVTLYNIRRERRNELIGEGARARDLKRWRSWDQLLTHRFLPQGINLWDQAYKKYKDPKTGKSILKFSGDNKANVSAPNDPLTGKYFCILRRDIRNVNELREGYAWRKAYYLNPLGAFDFLITAKDPTDPSTAITYQNPYWPTTTGEALE